LAGCGAQAPQCWDPNLGSLNFSAVVVPLFAVLIEKKMKNEKWFTAIAAQCWIVHETLKH